MSWRDIFLRSGGTSSDVGPSFNPAKPQSNACVGMRERLGTRCSDCHQRSYSWDTLPCRAHVSSGSPSAAMGPGSFLWKSWRHAWGLLEVKWRTNCSLPGVQLGGGHPWGPSRADICAPRGSGIKGSSARLVTLSQPVPLWQFYIFPVGTAL